MRAGTSITIYTLLLTFLMVLMTALPIEHAWLRMFLILYIVLLVGVMFGAMYLRLGRRSRKLREEVEQLAAQDSPLVIGSMIDVLGIDDRPTGKIARQALTRLAGQWSEEEVAALTPVQRTRLRSMVRGIRTTQYADYGAGHVYWQERAAFRVALCRGLGRCGNSEDLSLLRQLAVLPAVTPWARQVKQAAREAVPVLEARLAEKNRPHTLLRASNAPVAAPAELLRAASGNAPAAAGELLRAVTLEESPTP